MKYLAIILAVVILTAPAAEGIQKPSTIRITSLLEYIDWTSAGAANVYTLYNRSLTYRTIGNAQLLCVTLDARGPVPKNSRYCWGTYSIGTSGSIQVHGVARSRTYFQLAIVGGLGQYVDVSGTLTVIRYASDPVRERLIFQLR